MISPGEGKAIADGVGDGDAVGLLLALGVGFTCGGVEGSTYDAHAVRVANERVMATPSLTNGIFVVFGDGQTGPYGPVRTELARAEFLIDLAAAGDCTVSVTMVANNEAATSPVTRRRFPLNIELRIERSPINNLLIVTENQ